MKESSTHEALARQTKLTLVRLVEPHVVQDLDGRVLAQSTH